MAVTTLVCSGSQWNTVYRVLSASSGGLTTSDNNTLFPPSYLGDQFTEIAFRFSTTSSGTITVDQNLVVNGSMEAQSGGVLSNWVVDSGSVTASSSQQSRGTFSAKLSGASQAHEDILVNSGERFTITAAGFGDGSNSGRIQAFNQITQHYLTSSGGWQAAQTYCITPTTAAAWSTGSIVSTIEAFSATNLRDTMSLRISIVSTGSTVYIDDVYYWPSCSLVAPIGFLNVDPAITVFVQSSTDAFVTTTTEATMTYYQPSFFYAPASPIDKRYIRLFFSGVNSSTSVSGGSGPIYGGELALGQPTTLTRAYDPSKQIEFMDVQARSQTVYGTQRIIRMDQQPARTLTVPYVMTATSEYQQVRDVIYRRSGFGTYPLLVIPSSTDPEVCIYGHVEESWVSIEGPMPNFWAGSKLVLKERGFPNWVS